MGDGRIQTKFTYSLRFGESTVAVFIWIKYGRKGNRRKTTGSFEGKPTLKKLHVTHHVRWCQDVTQNHKVADYPSNRSGRWYKHNAMMPFTRSMHP
jgi:hypothetical protein